MLALSRLSGRIMGRMFQLLNPIIGNVSPQINYS